MCGIVGFIGNHQAAPILLDGLSKLEYRGYDSAGLAVRDGEKDAEIVKAKGVCGFWQRRPMTDTASKVPAGLGIQDGLPTENHQKKMPIPTAAMMAMWWPCITGSLRIIRN